MRTASLFWTSLLTLTASAGCTSESPQSSVSSWSTRGTTVVQMAAVTGVRELLVQDEQAGAAQTVTELTLRFDDGKIHRINIEPGRIFQPGERVKVISRRGVTRITHE